MNRVCRGLAVAALLVLAGCASGPGYKDASASFRAVPAGQGRIFFYRASSLGAAIQPEVKLNGEPVGKAVPKGFFFVDGSPGDYQVTTTTEVEKALTFRLDPGQTRYVRLGISMGFMVGHVYPELVDDAVGKKEIEKTKSIASN